MVNKNGAKDTDKDRGSFPVLEAGGTQQATY